jgi:uncharacterized protein (TIGR03086 family)
MPADLMPAAQRMAALVANVPDDRLKDPTPCADTNVAALLDHIGGLAMAFTAAAKKDGSLGKQAPSPSADSLPDDWRTRIPRDVVAMADAWTAPDAWTGMTKAGGIDIPGEVGGLIALDELVVHGWDLAHATGQPYECDDASLEAVLAFVAPLAANGAPNPGLFGPPVAVSGDAPLLERVIGLTGRAPDWSTA